VVAVVVDLVRRTDIQGKPSIRQQVVVVRRFAFKMQRKISSLLQVVVVEVMAAKVVQVVDIQVSRVAPRIQELAQLKVPAELAVSQ
jgi:hypothetical protein